MGDKRNIESTKLDYKLSLESEKPKSWLKSVSAFGNTRGGEILFGVTNDMHYAMGLDDSQDTASKISQYIAARISPVPRYEMEPFPSDDGKKTCIRVMVHSGPDYPYYYAFDGIKEAYVRHGDRSEKATDYELNNLILKGMNKTYDALPSYYHYDDVSFTLLNATYKQENDDELSFPKDLISMKLLTADNQVTNAGALLCDQGYLPQSKIVCTRWKGCVKGSIDGDALDDKEFANSSVISLLVNAEAFIRNNSRNAWTIRGMKREEKSDYPYKAVREVLVNAMIHRDYQILGAEIHVDMYDDRMEITSPGGMLNGSRIQDLDILHVPSMRRNEVISDIFGRLHYMDRRGSGIGRIMNSYAEFVEKPEFYSTDYYFSVMLPNRSAAELSQLEFEKNQLSTEKPQLSVEKSQLSVGKPQLSKEKSQLSYGDLETDWELNYFKDVVLSRNREEFKSKTVEGLIKLFERYRYVYNFNRRNFADVLNISENWASQLIKKCVKLGIIDKVKRDEYCFIADKNEVE